MTTDTATVPAGCQPLQGALRIPVTLIEPSPLNPRKRWKAEKVAEMAADLKAQGQIQPIRVRPSRHHTASNGRPPYEIVVGETRWRAAPAAGLVLLDALVADCTDHELIKLALAENSKRQDLHPLEEADAFDSLLRKPQGLQGYPTVQELAAGVGSSPSYVYQRLKLRDLCKAGRDAFLAGQIDASVALLIARMPNPEEQARATARIVAGFGGEAYSYRSASEYLKREFMLRLELARFDTAATYQVAGPCADCPKRSGASPDLFADVATGGDMCQDARCYQAKAEEAHQALLSAARDAGRTVLQGNKARAVLPSPTSEPVGHYRLDAPCPALTPSGRTLRELLGTGFAQHIVVVDLPDTAPVELVTADAARQAIKARGLLHGQLEKAKPAPKASAPAKAVEPPAAPTTAAAPPAPAGPPVGGAGAGGLEEAKARYERGEMKPAARPDKLEKRQPEAEASALHEAKCRKFGQLLASGLHIALTSCEDLGLDGLRLAVLNGFDSLSNEACELLYLVRGWTLPAGWSWAADFSRRVAHIDGRALGALLIELQVVEALSDGPNGPALVDINMRDLADSYGLDVQQIWRHAGICVAAGVDGTAAGAARRELDPTEAFVAQHGAGAAGSEQEVMDKPATTGWAGWEFPSRADN